MPHRGPLLLESLIRRRSDAHLLPEAPHNHRFSLHYYLSLPPSPSPGANDTVDPLSLALAQIGSEVTPISLYTKAFRRIFSVIWSILPPEVVLFLSTALTYWSPTLLEVLLVLAEVIFLYHSCCWMNKFRVPRPNCKLPAADFVENLHKEIHGQAFTPSSAGDGSPSPSPVFNDGHESDAASANALCGLAISDEHLHITQAPSHPVLTIPLRISRSARTSFNDLDDLHNLQVPPAIDAVEVTLDAGSQLVSTPSSITSALSAQHKDPDAVDNDAESPRQADMDALLEASWTWQQRHGHPVFVAPNFQSDRPYATVFVSSAASSAYARDGQTRPSRPRSHSIRV
ncbi:hypothetical protein C8Q74DRAFT_1362879 [Fomes fomentarius]|nr:hypothetical protein C8Q74DRAFT_1362879 [Fomes fomentarius]